MAEPRAASSPRRRLLGGIIRWVGALGLVALVIRLVDPRLVGERLRHVDWRWAAAFLVLSVPYYALVAWRWCFTAARVGAPLGFGRALGDYYLSTLMNQLLPVGIAGDVTRALRHRARLDEPDALGPPTRAVLLERLSGLFALALFVAGAALIWLARGRREPIAVGIVALALVAVGALLLALAARRSHTTALGRDGRAALVERGALAVQLALSTASVAALIGLFVCAARAAGVTLAPLDALQIVPLVLGATTIPWAFAGWGVREASTVMLFKLVGLDAASGLAASLTFGLLSLVAAAPGVVALLVPSSERKA